MTASALATKFDQDTQPGDVLEFPCLILAEDTKSLNDMLTQVLSERYTVYPALDGEEAWTLLRKHSNTELLITDINMPRLGGFDLIKRLRASENTRLNEMAVIVMTAAQDSESLQEAFDIGANDFVRKPVDHTELFARVKVHMRLAHTIRRLETTTEQLAELSAKDPLTQLRNRRGFKEPAEICFSLARRHDKELSIITLDIDHFKKVNDTYGHGGGDSVLVDLADRLRAGLRRTDLAARFGGEEFVVVLPETNLAGAAHLAERLRKAVEKFPFAAGGHSLPVTVSMGVSSLRKEPSDSLEALIEIADRRLYVAKTSGRNRVISEG